jgi:small subunit ribosomal protein S16
MLVIRMQRTGRKGHAQFRVVVQDARRTPTSGKIVASLGHFNPHTKETSVDKEKAAFYLSHGAQPSERVARLLKSEGVKLPAWVVLSDAKKREVRNADKRRSTRPEEPKTEEPAAEPAAADEAPAEAPAAPAEADSTQAPVEVAEDIETPAEEPVVEEAAPEEAVAAAEEQPEPTEAEEKTEA